MLKLASWNVNSLKIRLEHVLTWLESSAIDILALQETKIVDDNFPEEAFVEQGYHFAYAGQKTYNGVAIISRYPIRDVVTDIPDLEDPQRRILAATTAGIRLINLYVPNGSELNSEKYYYKLKWLEKVSAYIQQQLSLHPKVAVVGDFNIAPDDRDVHDPGIWQNCIFVSPAERKAFNDLLALGLVDSFRHFLQEEKTFSWWDYRAGAFRRNMGLRIDHVLLNKDLINLCNQSQIDKAPRKWERPSDHAPAWVELDLEVLPQLKN
ncbi:exodeoxyribonuclease III [Legionella micdadei]|uniref:Exodeoxyribonuclease III n=1 Tax=Legionella micdadei TaxID=451 RepID=A0A098GCM9_LEGMI|nr:exodeoxyribonuclease III [Legionella micdadei]ARG96519.1 exodeoxyribonuclease III [Legionella micdadei]ARG99270.1 exodeoxyribonuclease III [Legionella micdadei]KTD27844.1 exodeoxyribonuclease III [Legionella micdadei]NSL19554.1 exodeoxyribonuclease III [Legionella micdadei]CEG59750.1 Exodeoxyribonuclease III [Legionella micdadei]